MYVYNKVTSRPPDYLVTDREMMFDERHIAKLYHAPYVKWIPNSKVNPPENLLC